MTGRVFIQLTGPQKSYLETCPYCGEVNGLLVEGDYNPFTALHLLNHVHFEAKVHKLDCANKAFYDSLQVPTV